MISLEKKVLKIKMLPSLSGKSSTEVVDELVKQTINKVLIQKDKNFYPNENSSKNIS